MDEVFGRRDLISPAKLKELSVKSDGRGFLQLGSHVGAVALSGSCVALTWGTVWVVPAFILHGILFNFLYAGQHEADRDRRIWSTCPLMLPNSTRSNTCGPTRKPIGSPTTRPSICLASPGGLAAPPAPCNASRLCCARSCVTLIFLYA